MIEIQNEIDRINKIIYNMEKKERIKKMKKKIRNEFKGTIKEEIEKIIKNKNIEKEDCCIIIKLEISEFNCSKNLEDTPCNNIFDFKTFCLIYYENENKDLIDDIKTKHFKNIKKYTRIKNKNCLLFLVDFVFLYSIKELMKNINNYNIEIKSASNYFFLVLFIMIIKYINII